MKTVCIVSCFDCYQTRTKFIEKYYINKNFRVIHLIADFSHMDKKYYKCMRKNVEMIHVPQYKHNLSLQRINSHRVFSKRAYSIIKQLNPDIVYCNIPPNFVTKYMVRYKRSNLNKTLIFDLFDLWPESLLQDKRDKGIINIFFSPWKNLRKRYINFADYIITECDLYQKILQYELDIEKTYTLYPTKEETGLYLQPLVDIGEQISLCYIGSINNIIDMVTICNIIEEVTKFKKVILHIIGDGEKKNSFVNLVRKSGAEVFDYGIVYDDEKKYNIMSQCHFGLNIMKESVCVGLTLKSLCYFEAGLPIINNIKGDTHKLVEKYSAGINIMDENVVEHIVSLTLEEYQQMRANTHYLYDENLSERNLYVQLEQMNI